MCIGSPASSDPAVSGGHEDHGGGEGGDPLQVLWSSTHQLHLAQVQETSETHTHTHLLGLGLLIIDQQVLSCWKRLRRRGSL